MVPNGNKATFLNFLNKKGKKGKIEKVYNNLLLTLKHTDKTQTNPNLIFNNVLTSLKPKLKIQKISRFKSLIKPVKKSQQIFTALKWLTESSKLLKTDQVSSITNEIFNTLYKKSQSYRQKILWYKSVQQLKYTLRPRKFKKKTNKPHKNVKAI